MYFQELKKLVGRNIMSSDRLSNMLSSLKNAAMVGKPFVELPYTKECEGVANVLREAGYLEGVKTFKEKGKLGGEILCEVY